MKGCGERGVVDTPWTQRQTPLWAQRQTFPPDPETNSPDPEANPSGPRYRDPPGPRGRHPTGPLNPEVDPPVEMATEAVVKHPTGINSCFVDRS